MLACFIWVVATLVPDQVADPHAFCKWIIGGLVVGLLGVVGYAVKQIDGRLKEKDARRRDIAKVIAGLESEHDDEG
jgi:hypothetical protein